MFPPVPPPYVPSEQPRADLSTTLASAGVQNQRTDVRARELPPAPNPEEEILKQGRERFQRICEAEALWRANATKELDFVDGLIHWDQQMKDERKGRPCLTFDRIGPSVDQVVNDARQNPPEPRVSPVGAGADRKTADNYQGLIRNIINDSSGEIAHMTGYEHAVKIGRGWFRLTFDWEDDESFLQKIVINRIANPFSVYPDNSASKFDFSDMRFCFVTEDLDEGVFKDLYPNATLASDTELAGLGDKIKDNWFVKGAVRVAEYWWVETTKETLYQLPDGSTTKTNPGDGQWLNKRDLITRQVMGCKMTGTEVLKTWKWPGKWIPIIPVLGKEVIKEGKRSMRGMIASALDGNLSYDFMRSKEAEAVGLAPLSTWLAAKGQLDGQEYKWADANRRALAYLEYNPIMGEDNEPLPPPQRIQAEPAVQAISQAIAHADNDVKATLSTYDASLGAQGPESSGRAILARQREGDNAHFNYHGNLSWSLMHEARVIIDLAPHVYSEARMMTIVDPDGSTRQVLANSQNKDQWADGQSAPWMIVNPLRHDVTAGTGPSYASKRSEQKDAVMQLTPVIPGMAQRCGDLIADFIDLPKEFANRLRPPDIAQQQDQQQGPKDPDQMQGTIQQQGQLIQALTAQLQALTEDMKTKRVELEYKDRMNARDNATQLAIADLKTGADHATKLMQEQFDAITSELARLTSMIPPPAPTPAPTQQPQPQPQAA